MGKTKDYLSTSPFYCIVYNRTIMPAKYWFKYFTPHTQWFPHQKCRIRYSCIYESKACKISNIKVHHVFLVSKISQVFLSYLSSSSTVGSGKFMKDFYTAIWHFQPKSPQLKRCSGASSLTIYRWNVWPIKLITKQLGISQSVWGSRV